MLLPGDFTLKLWYLLKKFSDDPVPDLLELKNQKEKTGQVLSNIVVFPSGTRKKRGIYY